MVFSVVNLDPHHTQAGWVELPLDELGLDADALVPGARPAVRRALSLARRAQLRGARSAAGAGAHLPPAPPGAQRARLRLLHVRTGTWTGRSAFSSWPIPTALAAWQQRSAVVQGRRHLRGARARLLRQPTTTASATSPGSPASSTTSRSWASTPSGCCPSTRRRMRDDGYDIADYHNVHPQYGTRHDFRALRARGAPARPEGDHRAGDQPHLRSASVVPGARAAPRPARPSATTTCGATTPRRYAGHAHHLHRYRNLQLDLGRGGQGLLLAPLLQPPARPELRQSAGAQGGHPHACASGSTWAWTACGWTPSPTWCEREGTNNENLPRDARGAEGDPARASTSTTATACCWPKPTSGRRMCATISATATNATWPSTSR